MPDGLERQPAGLREHLSRLERLRNIASGYRSGRAIMGLLSDYAATLGNVVLSVVITPLFLFYLSDSLYGFWLATGQVLAVMNLLDGGVSVFLMRAISAAAGDNREESQSSLSRMISTTFWIYAVLGLVTGVVGLALSPMIPGWLNVPAESATAAQVTFAIAVANAALSLIAVPTFYGVLLGYQRMATVNGIVFATTSLGLLLSAAFLALGFGLPGMAMGPLLATGLGAVLAAASARRVCPALSISPRLFDRARLAEMAGFSGYVQLSKAAFISSTFSDGILLSISMGPAAVTVYALTQKLASMAGMFLTKVGAAIMPGLAELFAGAERERLKEVVLRLTRSVSRFGALAFVSIVVLNQTFVHAWVGPAAYGGLALTLLFAYSVFRNGLIRNLSSVLYASGQIGGWARLSALEVIVKVSLTLLLVRRFGLLAPIVATAVAELLTGIYTPVRVARLVGLPLATLLGQGVAMPLLRTLPTLAVLLAVSWALPSSWGAFGLAVAFFAGLCANVLVFDAARLRMHSARLMRVARPVALLL